MGLVRVRAARRYGAPTLCGDQSAETGTNRSWSWPELTTTRTGSRQLETVFDRGRLHTSAGAIGSLQTAAACAGPALGGGPLRRRQWRCAHRSWNCRELDSERPHRSDRATLRGLTQFPATLTIVGAKGLNANVFEERL